VTQDNPFEQISPIGLASEHARFDETAHRLCKEQV